MNAKAIVLIASIILTLSTVWMALIASAISIYHGPISAIGLQDMLTQLDIFFLLGLLLAGATVAVIFKSYGKI